MNDQFQLRRPYARLIAATDGSHFGETALLGAAKLAGRTGAELYVFHAAGDMAGVAAVTKQVTERLGDAPYKLEIRNLIAGTPMSPSRLVDEFADQVGDCVVVVGTHGRSGVTAALLGSTTAELVSRAGHATVVYGPRAQSAAEITTVVACVDGSEFSELSVEEGALWAVALKAPLRIVQVVPPGLPSYVATFEGAYVRNLSKALQDSGSGPVEPEVLHSLSPARAILDAFGNDSANMLVMATHGRVGFKRVTMGSVASEVVRGARGPAVLIRPREPSGPDVSQSGGR